MFELSAKIDEDIGGSYLDTRNPIVVYLMNKRPKQVSVFFEAVHSFSKEPLHFCHHYF